MANVNVGDIRIRVDYSVSEGIPVEHIIYYTVVKLTKTGVWVVIGRLSELYISQMTDDIAKRRETLRSFGARWLSVDTSGRTKFVYRTLEEARRECAFRKVRAARYSWNRYVNATHIAKNAMVKAGIDTLNPPGIHDGVSLRMARSFEFISRDPVFMDWEFKEPTPLRLGSFSEIEEEEVI